MTVEYVVIVSVIEFDVITEVLNLDSVEAFAQRIVSECRFPKYSSDIASYVSTVIDKCKSIGCGTNIDDQFRCVRIWCSTVGCNHAADDICFSILCGVVGSCDAVYVSSSCRSIMYIGGGFVLNAVYVAIGEAVVL